VRDRFLVFRCSAKPNGVRPNPSHRPEGPRGGMGGGRGPSEGAVSRGLCRIDSPAANWLGPAPLARPADLRPKAQQIFAAAALVARIKKRDIRGPAHERPSTPPSRFSGHRHGQGRIRRIARQSPRNLRAQMRDAVFSKSHRHHGPHSRVFDERLLHGRAGACRHADCRIVGGQAPFAEYMVYRVGAGLLRGRTGFGNFLFSFCGVQVGSAGVSGHPAVLEWVEERVETCLITEYDKGVIVIRRTFYFKNLEGCAKGCC